MPDKSNLLEFATMVKDQLKDAYHVNVTNIEEKTDLHGQQKVVIKTDGIEMWFRSGPDGSVTIDGISPDSNKAIGTVKINVPICHLRTSAMLVDKFDLSKVKNESDESNKTDEPDKTSKHEEPEDFEEEFTAPSNKFVIVDASALSDDHELAEKAISVPVKYHGAVFAVKAVYDDTILRSLTITPSMIDEGSKEVVKTTEHAVAEGMSLLSHDNQPSLETRTTLGSKHQKKGDKDGEVPMRVPGPGLRGRPKRDKSKEDQRYKERKAKRPIQRAKATKMHFERMAEQAIVVTKLIFDDKFNGLGVVDADGLETIGKILERMVTRSELSDHLDKINVAIEKATKALGERRKEESTAIVEHVEWMRQETKKIREQINQKASQPT
jgi:hypothetical protein